jgi:hypothetical protein
LLDFSFESVEDPTLNDFDFVHSLKFDSVRIYLSPKLFFCILKYIFAGYNVHHILSCSNISTDVVHISKERYILSANCPATMLGYRLIHVGFPASLPQEASSLTMKVFSLLHFFKMNMVAVTSDVMAWQRTLVFVVQVLLEVEPCLVSRICPQISLCKKKILITSKCRHMHGVLDIDEIKN